MLSLLAALLSGLIVGGEGGSFWHISDLHLDYLYEKGGNVSNFCHQQTGASNESSDSDVEEWGNYRCDSPLLLVDSALLAMKTIQSQPQFIVWTGIVLTNHNTVSHVTPMTNQNTALYLKLQATVLLIGETPPLQARTTSSM